MHVVCRSRAVQPASPAVRRIKKERKKSRQKESPDFPESWQRVIYAKAAVSSRKVCSCATVAGAFISARGSSNRRPTPVEGQRKKGRRERAESRRWYRANTAGLKVISRRNCQFITLPRALRARHCGACYARDDDTQRHIK